MSDLITEARAVIEAGRCVLESRDTRWCVVHNAWWPKRDAGCKNASDDLLDTATKLLAALACFEPGQDWSDFDGLFAEGDEYHRNIVEQVTPILAVAWPILSAPLRELHERVEFEWPRGSYYCLECYRASEDAPDRPCATIRLIEQTDKELGL